MLPFAGSGVRVEWEAHISGLSTTELGSLSSLSPTHQKPVHGLYSTDSLCFFDTPSGEPKTLKMH